MNKDELHQILREENVGKLAPYRVLETYNTLSTMSVTELTKLELIITGSNSWVFEIADGGFEIKHQSVRLLLNEMIHLNLV